jgi:hypothetical protein
MPDGVHSYRRIAMNRGRADHAKRRWRQATMPVAALAVMIAAGLPITAAAERNDRRPPDSQALNPQPLDSQNRMQAPIGHRQPRLQDLPPSLQREEEGGGGGSDSSGGRTRAQEDFDKGLQICKGC